MSVGNLYPIHSDLSSKLVAFGMDKQGTYGVWLQIMSWSAFVLNQRIQRFTGFLTAEYITSETEKTFVESK